MPAITRPTIAPGDDTDDSGGLGSSIRRFRNDLKFRHALYGWAVLAAFLLADILFLCVELPHHGALVRHTLLVTALLLLPLLLFVMAVRSPWGQTRIRPGYEIRPFSTLKSKPDYDGAALAAMLEREIANWRLNSVPGSQAESQAKAGGGGPNATLSLGGVTVPLPWLWKKLLFAVSSKQDAAVNGLLLDANPPFSIRVWSDGHASRTWEEWLGEGSFTDGLREAFRKVAFDVLEELEPRTVGLIDNQRWRDADASRLLSTGIRNTERDLELAYVYLDGGYLKECEGVLRTLHLRPLRGELYWQARGLEAQLHLNKGRFDEADAVLDKVLAKDACPQRWRSSALRARAEVQLGRGNYDLALKGFEACLTYLRTLQPASGAAPAGPSGAGTPDTPAWGAVARALASRSSEYKPDLVDALLLDLQGVLRCMASCRLQKSWRDGSKETPAGAVEELRAAVEVMDVRDTRFGYDRYVQTASLKAQLASLSFDQGNFADAEKEAALSASIFREIEKQSLADLASDPRNMKAQVDVAWSCLRLWVCYSLVYASRKELDRLDPKGAFAVDAGESTAGGTPGTIRFPAYGVGERPYIGVSPTENVATLLLGLPEDDRKLVMDLINRGKAQLDEPRCLRYLWFASLAWGESLLKRQQPGAKEIRDLVVGEDPEPELADEGLKAQIAALAARYQATTDLTEPEVRRLCVSLHDVVQSMALAKNNDIMNEWLETSAAKLNAISYGNRVGPEFRRLDWNARRPHAETGYGLACQAAINLQAADAARYLEAATANAGDDTFVYRERVPLDESFLRVRGTPEMEQFLGLQGTGGTPAV